MPNVCSVRTVPPRELAGKHPFDNALDAEHRFVIG